MNKFLKSSLIGLGIIGLIAICGAIWFSQNWHRMPGIMASIKNPTGPNQAVVW